MNVNEDKIKSINGCEILSDLKAHVEKEMARIVILVIFILKNLIDSNKYMFSIFRVDVVKS